jgi:hypothetical protein
MALPSGSREAMGAGAALALKGGFPLADCPAAESAAQPASPKKTDSMQMIGVVRPRIR